MVLSFGEVLMDCFPDKNVIGGAPFNVVVHLKRLGEQAAILSKIGKDKLGCEIGTLLENEEISDFLQKDNQKKTGQVDVTLNNGQPSYNIHHGCSWEFIDFELVKSPNYFMFGSLALNFIQNRNSFKQYRSQFKQSIFVCDLNLRTPFYSEESIQLCLESADILKINDEELDYLAEKYAQTDVIGWLLKIYGINKVLLTKGSEGATLFWVGKVYECKVKPVDNIEDTVGAGDSFTALFLHGLIHKLPFEECLERAADFAGIICTLPGAIPVDKSIYNDFKI